MKIKKEQVVTYKIEVTREDYEQLIFAVESAIDYVHTHGDGERVVKFGHAKFNHLLETLKENQ